MLKFLSVKCLDDSAMNLVGLLSEMMHKPDVFTWSKVVKSIICCNTLLGA